MKNNKMLYRISIFYLSLLAVSGCVYNDEPMPRITHTAKPQLNIPESNWNTLPMDNWLPAARQERKWTAIVIHHSGTKNGNAAIFDNWHKNGRHWEGVGYNFVIGNGTDSGDGQVEVTFRWREQKTGAHCGGTHDNWANKQAIGICLVGNFNKTSPTYAQMHSLVRLIRFLQSRYGIPANRIYGHNTVRGAHITDCPGRNFSLVRLKSMLKQN